MATETQEQAPKRQRGQAPTSLKAAREQLAANKPAFDAYEEARLARKNFQEGSPEYAELTDTMAKNREGFTVYWRAYNSEPAKAQRLKEREARKEKAAKPAAKRAGKAAAKAEEPAEA